MVYRKLEKNKVYILPFPLSKLFKGMVFMRKIYLRKDVYQDVFSANPKPESLGVFIHELAHLERIKKKGKFYPIFYWLFKSVCYQEEL